MLQVVLFNADGTAVIKLTETRNVFQAAPGLWDWADPIDAERHFGNIVGNIGLERLVEELSEGQLAD